MYLIDFSWYTTDEVVGMLVVLVFSIKTDLNKNSWNILRKIEFTDCNYRYIDYSFLIKK